MTTDKQKLIQSMIEMQKKFIEYEHEKGLSLQDYFAPESDHPLADYKSEYDENARQLVELAHAEKQSNR